MEQGPTAEKGACCEKGKCCGGKALAVIALLAIGGAGGFLCARQCPATGGSPAASTPAK